MRQRRRGAGIAAPGTLLLAVLAALVGQIAPAAAATPPAASASAAPSAASPATPAAPSASPGTAPAAGPKAAPTMDPKTEQAAAARELAEAGPTGACPETLTAGTVVTCTLEGYQSATLSFTLTQAQDLVFVQAVGSSGGAGIYQSLAAPDGTAVTCESPSGGPTWGSSLLRCATGQAGTYKLTARDGSGQQNGLAVSYLPLLSPGSCKAASGIDLALGAPTAFHGELPVGSSGHCFAPAELAAGDVLRLHSSVYQTAEDVYDATGKRVCTTYGTSESTELDCKLAGPAPYRVTTQQVWGSAQTYDLTLARLTRPEGCPVVDAQAFGVAPDLSPVARCRALRFTEQAPYSFAALRADGSGLYGGLFAADGTQQFGGCATHAGCQLPPGTYTWVVEGRSPSVGAFGMSFRSDAETRGCTPAKDDGLVSGPATGTFGAQGAQACRTLPTASGNGLYLLDRPPTGGSRTSVTVYDAAGAVQCDHVVCKLTGTAPFRAVLSGTANQAYQLVIHRTGETAGCAAWSRSGYDGSWGAEVTLTNELPQACLALPADQHSTAEMADYTNTQNQLNAALEMVDPQGNVACSTASSSVITCPLTAGVSYTALLTNLRWGDSYKLVRRDISPSADCLAPVSTTAGGRSVPMDLHSALDARCVRVAAAATDKFWLGARPTGGSVQAQVLDADGRNVCVQGGVSCKVTGSTSYTVLVLAAGYQGKDIHVNVDTWKVGTADGWAAECTAHPLPADGFPVRSGVLTESSSGYCAVIDMKPSQSFSVFGTSSAVGGDQPSISLVGPAMWDGYDLSYQCSGSYGQFGTRCQTTQSAAAGQAVLVVSAAKAATPVEYSMQGACGVFDCSRPRVEVLGSISPATGAAGTQTQAVLRGSNLTLGSKVKLSRNGSWSSTQPFVKPISVSPDSTSLTVLVDTNGLEPGSYDLLLDAGGTGSGLTKAFTVTPAVAAAKGRFVPVTPARILNTVSGVGAPAGRLGQGGVVSLQVTGVGGVPTTGVTAVVMNVTAVNPSQNSAVSVYPSGQAVPDLPTVSFAAGQNVPNLVTVPPANGKVDIRNAWGSVDLGVDIAGYYTDSGAGALLSPVTPARILNTVSGVGAPAGRVGGGGVVPLQVTGVGGVPATGVTAVVMSVTAVNPSQVGYVTVYPNGQAAPDASNLNFTAGQNVSNLVTVPVVNGKVDIRNAWGSVDLGVDVVGYYGGTGASYSAARLVRLLDTRDGEGARAGVLGGAEDMVSLKVAGVEGVPATGVTSALLNVTTVWPTETSFLTVYPHGIDRPDASNINYRPGTVVSALVMVPVVDGRVSFANQWGSTDVVADLIGYFSA
ncbi:hypothetical protein ACIF6L_22015 [Kitasatospora sp. NPDC086009]|uniref:hypothetical protein n=1 Tax=unclassified Kitasatospora TaxID=2633591 RepID=UPI0037C94831